MALDPYSPCPCGSGKKLKFCCADMATELEKISRMLQADQRLACLDYIEQLEKKHGPRVCFYPPKVMLEMSAERFEAAAASAKAFAAMCPDNPVAMASLAMTATSCQAAAVHLQDALERFDDGMPGEVFYAIGHVADFMLEGGHPFGALAHRTLAVMFNHDDQETLREWLELRASREVPLLFRDGVVIEPAPHDAAWRADYESAIEPTRRGRWREALARLTALAERVGDEPVVWRAIGSLSAALADDDAGHRAYARVASMSGIADDDAVEAEAMTMLLGEIAAPEMVDSLTITYRVADFERLVAVLSVDRRAARRNEAPRRADSNEPPPRLVVELLDRPMPESIEGVSLDQLPQALGVCLAYGRETDREPRVEVLAYRPDVAKVDEALRSIAHDALGEKIDEHVDGQMLAANLASQPRWRVPADSRADQLRELLLATRRQSLLEVWPTLKHPTLAGRTVEELAADPSTRRRAEAAVLLQEAEAFAAAAYNPELFGQLRARLGLRQPPSIDPTAVDLSRLPLVRLHRVEVEKLSDDEALSLYRRAMMAAHRYAVLILGPSIATRPGLAGRVDPAEVYGVLVTLAENADQALAFIELYRKALEDSNRSSAPADVAELRHHLERLDPQNIQRVMNHLEAHHIREPGVGRAVMELLVEFGVISPDGRMPAGMADGGEAAMIPEPVEAAPGKIWTPGGEAASQGKAAIWMPGMD